METGIFPPDNASASLGSNQMLCRHSVSVSQPPVINEVWHLLSYTSSLLISIIYFFRLIPQVAENGAAREACQRRRPTKAEGLRRRPKAYAEGLQEGEVPREGGRG